jgi:vacuolar protein sorting-associated protein VTA1
MLKVQKIYMCASIFYLHFILCLEQIEQKQKYAIWKAAEIRKAIKEGRKPEPGPPGGDKDEAPVSTTTISQVLS